MKAIIPAVAAMIFAVSPAFASEGHCDADIKAVDAALSKAKLSDADAATVKAARAKAEGLHKAGKEEECEKSLMGAHKLLGIKEEHQE
ncbi:hypothetical protein [Steroidobacter sp.]|uniref:hypothetical protein n=1 Tax=Steroidobacter sp. TaxID=1978227 RepID=UPI001A5BA776|nr:hypothetical protein [Steroidobacter sp.]MBL8269764.1 hypothetical protein [Steroidobacter sp.]